MSATYHGTSNGHIAIKAKNLHVYYGDFRAVKDISLNCPQNNITALIGPSGCGKSTVLRSFNRMNDLVPSARVEGEVLYQGHNIYGKSVDPVEVRRRVGMVFQKPNPFPKSIYDNVAWGARINGYKGNLDHLVESALRQAALWDEVKDKLGPERLFPLRRPAAAPVHRPHHRRQARNHPDGRANLGPGPGGHAAHRRVNSGAKKKYTIIIVTHNMQQAARASDYTAFFNMDE
jgi:phosphate transport system ATP-binding protein